MNNIESSTGEIVMYQPDETIRLEVNSVVKESLTTAKDRELVEAAVRKESLLTATSKCKILQQQNY